MTNDFRGRTILGECRTKLTESETEKLKYKSNEKKGKTN